MPILVLEGWDDADDSTAVGVNYGMITTPGNKVYYVNADAGAFNAQHEELKELEMQMSTLGISKLSRTKVRRRVRRRKTHRPSPSKLRPLAIISMELESSLQQALLFCRQIPRNRAPQNHPQPRLRLLPPLRPRHLASSVNSAPKEASANQTYLEILRSGEIIPDKINLTDELAENPTSH